MRAVLPMEEVAARASADDLEDPFACVCACALNVVEHLTTDAHCPRVFEICCVKAEYVDEMVQVRRRHIEARNNCLKHLECGLRNAGRSGLLAPSVNPRLAGIGVHAPVDGLIVDWVLDPAYLPLAQDAKTLVAQYIERLRAGPVTSAPRRGERVPNPAVSLLL